ncbi:GIY-YIG nuclease family protein [candidate division KSB1 bacterium]|nr:GIY-YIG nuclease family protein [candidate division KSB1 bacterium]
MTALTLKDIIDLDTLSGGTKIKLVRHFDSRLKIENEPKPFLKLVKQELLEEYQRYQARHIFNCDNIVSFYGEENSKAVFYGIYKVEKFSQDAPPVSDEFKTVWSDMEIHESTFYYTLTELPEYRKYRNRLVIKWGEGASTRMWHQWYDKGKNKEVIEIRPKNYIGDFPGVMNIMIDYWDLKKMIDNPESHRIWYHQLSQIFAVYAILDKVTGKVYIGSAYGTDGLWGRWSDYIKSKSCGNKLLDELLQENPAAYLNFQFSVLEVLPYNTKPNDVIAIEKSYKGKLGSRFFGLNAN